VTSPQLSYEPVIFEGAVSTRFVIRGDANGDLSRDIADIVYIVQHMFNLGPPPVSLQAGDANSNLSLGIDDLVYLVDYYFKGGPSPATP
jgi:hypothetical protein